MEILDPSSDNLHVFKEKVNGVYVNLASTYSNVVAYLYNESGDEIKKWSRELQAGYDSIYATDNYTLEFYIYRELLINYKGKTVKLEIKAIRNVASRGLTDDKEHSLGWIQKKVGESKMGTAA